MGFPQGPSPASALVRVSSRFFLRAGLPSGENLERWVRRPLLLPPRRTGGRGAGAPGPRRPLPLAIVFGAERGEQSRAAPPAQSRSRAVYLKEPAHEGRTGASRVSRDDEPRASATDCPDRPLAVTVSPGPWLSALIARVHKARVYNAGFGFVHTHGRFAVQTPDQLIGHDLLARTGRGENTLPSASRSPSAPAPKYLSSLLRVGKTVSFLLRPDAAFAIGRRILDAQRRRFAQGGLDVGVGRESPGGQRPDKPAPCFPRFPTRHLILAIREHASPTIWSQPRRRASNSEPGRRASGAFHLRRRRSSQVRGPLRLLSEQRWGPPPRLSHTRACGSLCATTERGVPGRRPPAARPRRPGGRAHDPSSHKGVPAA